MAPSKKCKMLKEQMGDTIVQELAQGIPYKDLTAQASVVWVIDTCRKVTKLPPDQQREALRKALKSFLLHEPIDIDPGMGYFDKDHWKPQLGEHSKAFEEKRFTDLQAACSLIPMAFHVIWPHSRKELDFVMNEMLSHNFITTFSPEAQAKIKEMAWRSDERFAHYLELAKTLPHVEYETPRKGAGVYVWMNRFGFYADSVACLEGHGYLQPSKWSA